MSRMKRQMPRNAAAACFAFVAACGDGTSQRDAAEASTSVYLRLRNMSDVSFDAIVVRVNETIEFGGLPARADSEYLPADGIYSYAYIEGTSGENRFVFQPDDYTGETPLGPGYYTYVLSVAVAPSGERVGWFDIGALKDPAPSGR
jgi:hypothetical protein